MSAMGAGASAAGVCIGNAIACREMVIISTGFNPACAVDTIARSPSGDGFGTVDLCCTAMFCIIGNTNISFNVHIVDAGLGQTASVLTNAGFPA